MSGEIKGEKDFYCSVGAFDDIGSSCYLENGNGLAFNAGVCRKERCPHYHRKHPTPEQFKKEYSKNVPDDMPVWILCGDKDALFWEVYQYGGLCDAVGRDVIKKGIIVIACTPFGKPDDTWRPE